MYTPPATPRPLSIPNEARPLLQVLPTGRVLDATVYRGETGRLTAVAGRLQLPLPAGTGLSEGDTVTLRIIGSSGGHGKGVELLQNAGPSTTGSSLLPATSTNRHSNTQPSPSPSTPLRLDLGTEGQNLIRGMPPGRVLQATVQRSANGELVASAGRTRLPLPTGIGLAEGEPLTLRITGGERGKGVEVLPGAGKPADAVSRLQRQHLPQQMPVAQAVRTLQSADPATLPPAVGRSLDNLTAALPTPQQLQSPEGLRLAMRDSGSLFESLMIARPEHTSALAGRDLRAQLQRLAGQLRQAGSESPAAATNPRTAPPALAEAERAATAALSRQLLHQVAAHTSDGHVQLTVELPVSHAGGTDDLRLSVQEEPPDESSSSEDDPDAEVEARWRVTVRLRFADAGELEARLYLDEQGAVGVTWRADNEVLRATLDRELPLLDNALAKAGLSVSGLTVSDRAPEPDNPMPLPGVEGLINDQA